MVSVERSGRLDNQQEQKDKAGQTISIMFGDMALETKEVGIGGVV